MPYAAVNGIDLYFERSGSGPRLLFIDGTGGDLRQKPSLVEGPLAREFEILAHDQRGLGQSGKPDVPYTMPDYADDAAARAATPRAKLDFFEGGHGFWLEDRSAFGKVIAFLNEGGLHEGG